MVARRLTALLPLRVDKNGLLPGYFSVCAEYEEATIRYVSIGLILLAFTLPSLKPFATASVSFISNDAAYKFGSQCVVCAIDAKRTDNGKWEVYLNGGRIPTGIDAVLWATEAEKRGAGEILLTSMDCDGQKKGYDLELTRAVSESVGIPVIASGGAGELKHFYDAFTVGKADAVLAASLFHFNEIPIESLKKYLNEKNIPVRPV